MFKKLALAVCPALALHILAVWSPLRAADSDKVGRDTCVTCHDEMPKLMAKSPHQDCEGCHGAGAKHAESADPTLIIHMEDLPVKDVDKTCLSCHRGKPTQVGRLQGGHGRNQVACTTCHSIHHQKPKAQLTAQCGSCHTATVAEFNKPFRHKVPEGVMSCVDCHNPHGNSLGKSVRLQFNEPGCLKCHGDKRGPFVFEHAPMRLEGCSACHEPHGSANPRMLARHEPRVLCLECHSGVGAPANQLGGPPSAFHDLRIQRYQNCTLCHIKVHGSHVNRDFLR